MTSGNTNATSLANSIVEMFHRREFLKNFKATLRMSQFGSAPVMLPAGEGDKVKWHRYKPFTTLEGSVPAYAITTLADGVSPASAAELSTVVVSAQLTVQGGHVIITDQAEFQALNRPVKNGAIEELGRVAGYKYEDVIVTALDGNATQKQVNDAVLSALQASDTVDANEVLKQASRLKKAGVERVDGSNYVGIFSDEQLYDLKASVAAGNWLDVHKYAEPGNIYSGEEGRLFGVRLISAHRLPSSSAASASNVRSGFVLGKGGYGIADATLTNKVQLITKPMGYGNDPLNQRASVGYKMMHAAKILQATAIIQLNSAATSL